MPSATSLFDTLPDTERIWLGSVLVQEQLAEGCLLVEADSVAQSVWLLEDAITARVAAHPGGASREAGLDAEGSLVCPFTLLGDGKAPWSVQVRRAGNAWRLDRDRFEQLRREAPSLQRLAECKAQEASSRMVREFALGSCRSARTHVAVRLCDYFRTLEDSAIRITHRELARLLHLRRETVTLALQQLEGERVIRSLRGRIELVDSERLAMIAALE